MRHVRETTTSTDLLIRDGGDHPEGQFLVDCSCGEEYYVKPVDGLTEFESLERGRREHAARAEGGTLYNLLYLYKGLEVQDIHKMALGTPGTMNLKGIVHVVQDAFMKLFDRIEQLEGEYAQAIEDGCRNDEQVLAENERLAKQVELLQAELNNVRESSVVAVRHLEAQVMALSPSRSIPSSGILPPLTRLIMVAEELDSDHEYWAVGCGEPASREHRLDEKARVLREVYGDLKPVLSTVHPDSAYVGDRVRATWEVWEDGNFVEKVTKEGVVTHASVPGKNFITFLDDGTGLTHGPLVHNYEVIERFKLEVED